jgi:hypothetical protein
VGEIAPGDQEAAEGAPKVPCGVVLAEWVKSALPALKNYVRPKWGILADGTCNNGML